MDLASPKKVRRTCIADVLSRWRTSGPLIHQATCFDELNRATSGGPVFGSRWYVMGAPDASKTLLLTQLAHIWSEAGVTVGMLAVDEEDEDLVTRIAQRTAPPEWNGAHFQRGHCEGRDSKILDLMQKHLANSTIVFYGDDCTIEDAARDLAELATIRGQRAILMVDSIQTVECSSVRMSMSKDVSTREKITSNVRAIRSCASEHKMLVMCTSEMNRSAYKAIGKAEQNDMAAAKESGAIEYSARVMLALRNVQEEDNCIEVKVIKNKHGPSFPHLEPFYLSIDRHTQWLHSRTPPLPGPSLIEQAVAVVSGCPAGKTSDDIRRALGKKKQIVDEVLTKAAELGLLRRLNGAKSPWITATVPDTDGDDFR